ncbi:hypothetical protein [Agromyces sp. Marseille-Q5079]|uniref:hypothetical protein n=1 Tax=Agromyces sp. Marseille-Q5079 TaxID=3439059 RepID=UPI003D9C8F2C
MIAAIALTVILGVLAVFQLALALGAPLGHFAWGGSHRVLPAKLRIGSLVSIVIYALIAVLALDRAAVIDVVPDVVSTVGMWVVFGYFVLGIAMNAISRSKPERYTMTPIVAVLAALSLIVALG